MQLRRSAPAGESPVIPQVVEGRETPTQEWEYEILADPSKDLKDRLNELGEKGWILVATTPAFIFRRPKRAEPDKFLGPVGFGSPRD